uniref:Uncharacterized protein n=1 Tax=Oryza meridionalis TaxID=40149 RepID=A0A0E0CNV1_9ORYZ
MIPVGKISRLGEMGMGARLFKEYKEVQREKSADPDIQLICDDSNIFKWTALIKTGEICLDILKNAWSPAWTLQSARANESQDEAESTSGGGQPPALRRHQRLSIHGKNVY